jgi:hypothetical protein
MTYKKLSCTKIKQLKLLKLESNASALGYLSRFGIQKNSKAEALDSKNTQS